MNTYHLHDCYTKNLIMLIRVLRMIVLLDNLKALYPCSAVIPQYNTQHDSEFHRSTSAVYPALDLACWMKVLFDVHNAMIRFGQSSHRQWWSFLAAPDFYENA
jgi:hypothetical protein